MNDPYKAGDLRHTLAAIACAIVLGSTLLVSAVTPTQAASTAGTTVPARTAA